MTIDKALRIGVGPVFSGRQTRPQWLAVSTTGGAAPDLSRNVHASALLEIPARGRFRSKTAFDSKFQRVPVAVGVNSSALTVGNEIPIEWLQKTNRRLALYAKLIGNVLVNSLNARKLFETNQGAPHCGFARSLVATELVVRTTL